MTSSKQQEWLFGHNKAKIFSENLNAIDYKSGTEKNDLGNNFGQNVEQHKI